MFKRLYFFILIPFLLFSVENKTTKELKVAVDSWAPFYFEDEQNKIVGISVDYWELIKKKIGLKSQYQVEKNWTSVLNKIKAQEVDMVLAAGQSKERLEHSVFSKPYFTYPIAFATYFDKEYIYNASFLEGKKVAVGKDYLAHKILEELYPKIDFVLTKDTENGIRLLNAKEVYAVADALPVLAYHISKNGYSNLKISGNLKKELAVSFMFAKKNAHLVPIINEAISSLTLKEKDDITKKWFSVRYDTRIVDFEYFPEVLIIIVGLLTFYFLKQRDLKKHNIELEKISNTDTLTKLPNRRKIDAILSELENTKYSLIIVDIDHFKSINDNYSHLEGDRILKEFSNLIRKNLNKNDIVGRWGGEEFIIICKNTNEQEATIVANRLRSLVENHDFKLKKITASFGVAQGEKSVEVEKTLVIADKALYQAKEEGRNLVVNSKDLKS